MLLPFNCRRASSLRPTVEAHAAHIQEHTNQSDVAQTRSWPPTSLTSRPSMATSSTCGWGCSSSSTTRTHGHLFVFKCQPRSGCSCCWCEHEGLCSMSCRSVTALLLNPLTGNSSTHDRYQQESSFEATILERAHGCQVYGYGFSIKSVNEACMFICDSDARASSLDEVRLLKQHSHFWAGPFG